MSSIRHPNAQSDEAGQNPVDNIPPSSWPTLIEAITAVSVKLQQAQAANRNLSAELLVPILAPLEKIIRTITNNETPSSADFWTNSQAVVELLSSVDKVIWVASLIDDIAQPGDPSPFVGFSWWGVGFGSFLALLLALAELYCHKIINIVNQTNDSGIFNEAVFNETPLHMTSLTFKQKIALSCETISHIGDIGSKFAMYSKIFCVKPTWLKMVLHGAGGVLGIFGTVAETRTHWNSMLRFNSIFSRNKTETTPAEIEADANVYHRMEEGINLTNLAPLRRASS